MEMAGTTSGLQLMSPGMLVVVVVLMYSFHVSGGETSNGGSWHQDCINVNLTALEGTIMWEEGNNSANCSWVISLNESYGLAIRVDEVYLATGNSPLGDDTLTIYQGPLPVADRQARSFSGDLQTLVQLSGRENGDFSLPVGVLLLHHHQALLQLHTRHRLTYTPREGHTAARRHRFKVAYMAVTRATMPPQVGQDRYNCSPPYEVPTFLKCDVGWQCVEGEDEAGWCPYNSLCGQPRLWWEGECRRFSFPRQPVAPMTLKNACQYRHNNLGNMLQDPVALWFYGRILTLSGYKDMFVSMSRVQTTIQQLAQLYRFLWTWYGSHPRVIYDRWVEPEQDSRFACGVLHAVPVHLQAVSCTSLRLCAHVCSSLVAPPHQMPAISLQEPPKKHFEKVRLKQCPDKSLTQNFLPCFGQNSRDSELSQSDLPLSVCDNGVKIHYSLICDGFDDCGDNSEETLCWDMILNAEDKLKEASCENSQRVSREQLCDGSRDCHDGSDEKDCLVCQSGMVYCDGLGCLPRHYLHLNICSVDDRRYLDTEVQGEATTDNTTSDLLMALKLRYRPEINKAVLDLDGYGMALVRDREVGQACSETHVDCGNGLCIAVYLVNNGQLDCPYPWSDETDEDRDVSCPGFYRCYRYPRICLHGDHLCDGIYQCPLKDDERYCQLVSPPDCSREGHALTCRSVFPESYWYNLTDLRYLDLSGVPLTRRWLANFDHYYDDALPPPKLLSFLNLSSCNISEIDEVFYEPPLLRVLDVSFNNIKLIALKGINDLFPRLQHLILSHNPLLQKTDPDFRDIFMGTGSTSLISLAISDIGMEAIAPGEFGNFSRLEVLDIRANDMKTVYKAMFDGLTSLRHLYTDDPTMCCIHNHAYPDNRLDCHAPVDELSSCDDLLRSHFFRGFLWTLSLLAITGNIGVLVYRVFLEKTGTSTGFRVLVSNLCVSDLLMGVYLLMIGCADLAYRGRYLWERDRWTGSVSCRVAGFLALLSSEVSALTVCVITLDRLLVLRFPLKRHFHMSVPVTTVAVVVVWVVCLLVAAVPLFPSMRHWEFYSQTGVCLPLPITRRQFLGRHYAFNLFIVFNFVLFILIGAGQLLIYQSVRSTQQGVQSQRHQHDLTIARRLFLIVFSDFCCWFPIGLMGVLSSRGTPIPGVVNVWAAIFVVPLNSAINPFLYTLNTLIERRRKEKLKEMIQALLNRLAVEIGTWPEDKVQELARQTQRILKRGAAVSEARQTTMEEST